METGIEIKKSDLILTCTEYNIYIPIGLGFEKYRNLIITDKKEASGNTL